MRTIFSNIKTHLPYMLLALVLYSSLTIADAYASNLHELPFSASNDLTIHIPRAFKLDDPKLFARDPAFASFSWESFGRLDMLLYPLLLSKLFPVLGGIRPTLIVLSFVLGLVFMMGIYWLTHYLAGDPLAGVIAAFLASLSYWALSAVQLGFTPSHVLPRNFIVAVSPVIIVLFLRWRARQQVWVLYALLGLMANFHALAALHLVLIFMLTLLVTSGLSWGSMKRALVGGAASLTCALPLALTFLPTLAGVVTVTPEEASVYVTRYAHAIRPSWADLSLFGLTFLPFALFGGFGISRYFEGREGGEQTHRVYSIMYLVVLLLPWMGQVVNMLTLSLTKLEMLRITRYYFLLAFAPIGALLANWFRGGRRVQFVLAPVALFLIMLFSRPQVGIVLLQRGVEWLGPDTGTSSEVNDPADVPEMAWDWYAFSDLCHWADSHTPADALFLAPVDWSLFWVYGRRGLVVTWKGAAWSGWAGRYVSVQEMYAHPDGRKFIDIARTYAADYIVVMPGLVLPGLDIVYQNDHYVIYEASDLTRVDGSEVSVISEG